MTRFLLVPLAAILLLSFTPALARSDRDQTHLRQAAAQGQVMPLNRLVAEVRSRPPYNGMTYLGGPQYDSRRMIYTLKFMDGSRVVMVYVDARSGRVVGRNP